MLEKHAEVIAHAYSGAGVYTEAVPTDRLGTDWHVRILRYDDTLVVLDDDGVAEYESAEAFHGGHEPERYLEF